MIARTPTDDTDNLVTFDSREQAGQLALALIEQARQEICFFGPIIDPVLLGSDTAVAKLSEFVRRSSRTFLRIVVHDTRKNVIDSHRLLPLAQKLTSSIKIQIAGRKHQDLRQQFMLIDGKAYLYCPVADYYQGRVERYAPAKVKVMQQDFEDIWNHSKPDINVRWLNL
jgi:hypothetical protein